MQIDKSSWEKVKLIDVVTKKEENDKENAKNRFERFIKVEHLNAESLHIKRWGNQNKDELPPTFYKVFRKGQVLFPTRNPHLRRTALASFDGICGEKTLTLEPNEEKVLPEFLPFLFHSNEFYQHTTSSIVGSTNPHVRWRDVASYEFLLPPKDQQAKLAELLWAMEEVVENDLTLLDKLSLTLDSDIESRIHGVTLAGHTIQQVIDELSEYKGVGTLSQFGKIFKGKGITKSELVDIGLPCVRYGELYTKHHRVIRKFYSFITDESSANSIKLKQNDVLFAGSGETISEIGKSAAFISDEEVYAGGDILIFRPYDMDGIYLGYLLNSQLVRQQLNKFGTGATVMHVYASDIEKIKVPIFEKDEQINIGQHLESIADNISNLNKKIENSQKLKKSLINQIF
ncbi:restriction endonuclease subunit S [Methyloprofundus sedimenti]|nr:restriction endonuclease subunit S [Methyloprofundus sedimenti]